MPATGWRRWVALTGRVLVAAGLLLLAFVGYQLWGTGIQTAQAQNQLEDDFADLLDGAASTTTASPTTAPATTAPGTTVQAPTTTLAPPTTTPPALGDPVARLEVPAIGLDWIVVSGVGVDELKKGPGHYPDTPLPGQVGNVGIAGHRTTYGAPFYRIDELGPGDQVILTTPVGRYVYDVTEQFIVSPSQYEVLAPTPGPTLTLTSCHPRYSANQRIIVKATLDEAQSSPLNVTATAEAATPVTDPVTAATLAPTDTATATATGTGDTTAVTPTTTVADSSPTADNPAIVTPELASAELLGQGWFDDPDAWPQVALWGLALTAVALAAWRLSQRTGHNWIGALAGIVPFLFCLYFFFENVNRLLPPNI